MSRRVIATLAAIFLAVVGAVVLINYVNSADERALAGMVTQSVLVATAPIPQGTAADSLAGSVTNKDVPATTVVPGALSDLTTVSGLVLSVDIQPGEQLLEARFVAPDLLSDPRSVPAPDGYQEVTIQLEAQRVLGGTLAAGDLVGVIMSGASLDGEGQTVTSNILDQVLVTRIALTEQAVREDGEPLPQSLFVTLAVTTPQAERVVYGMEFSSLWLTRQPEGPLQGTSEVVNGGIIAQ